MPLGDTEADRVTDRQTDMHTYIQKDRQHTYRHVGKLTMEHELLCWNQMTLKEVASIEFYAKRRT